ncbi:uncharacterized protein T551_00717 [Pneumocystis jirovecii RU7]|uniref:Small ribosomal subunit protein mS29 n=1 Tax=Pneumocystis jirovecii (strain RU7) TaxID=1408657 RepID=A0A0W4ZUL3_PNEJ7|nr:uncharacterized protein T551_00717 [Pneumocystis jirovecii RU7]KTW32035.1 hypothetical protein T551_00717 [Pneumocystis jirovecii RU7]
MGFQFYNCIFKHSQKTFFRYIHTNTIVNIGKDKYKRKGFVPKKKKQSFDKNNVKTNIKLNDSPRILSPLESKLLLSYKKESYNIGIQNLNIFDANNIKLCGRLFNFPLNILQKMKNLDAFRFEHKIDFSNDPVIVLRECSIYISQKLLDDNVSSKNRRIVLIGDQGTGKSFCLLQAQCWAFQKGWIVLAIPRGLDIVNNTTPFFYHKETGLWRQPEYTSSLLEKFSKANFDILNQIFLSREYYIGNCVISKFTSLFKFLEIGVLNSSISHEILEIFLKELNIGNCPPVLFTFDNISVVCSPSQYMSSEYKTIHPYELALIRTFFTYLNGEFFFDRGAIISCASKIFSKSDRMLEISLGFLEPKSYENVDKRVLWAVNGVEYYVVGNYTPVESENIIRYYFMSNIIGKNIDNVSKEFVKEKMLLSGNNPREVFWNCVKTT